MMSLH